MFERNIWTSPFPHQSAINVEKWKQVNNVTVCQCSVGKCYPWVLDDVFPKHSTSNKEPKVTETRPNLFLQHFAWICPLVWKLRLPVTITFQPINVNTAEIKAASNTEAFLIGPKMSIKIPEHKQKQWSDTACWPLLRTPIKPVFWTSDRTREQNKGVFFSSSV